LNERRREPRFAVRWPARIAHRTEGCVYGHVANVSGNGFLFVAPSEIAVDELVEMEITVNPLFVIRCAARIARVERMEGEWAFGAVFHSLGAQDTAALAQTLVAIGASQADNALSFRPKAPLLPR
jgi:hypothetical protein